MASTIFARENEKGVRVMREMVDAQSEIIAFASDTNRRARRSPSFSDVTKADPDREARRIEYEKRMTKMAGAVKKEDPDVETWGKGDEATTSDGANKDEPVEKESANFGLSGALAKDTNTVMGG